MKINKLKLELLNTETQITQLELEIIKTEIELENINKKN